MDIAWGARWLKSKLALRPKSSDSPSCECAARWCWGASPSADRSTFVVAQKLRRIKEELDQTRVEVERAQREFDYNKAAELSYGKAPKLEEELAKAEAELSAGGKTLLKTEVDAQDIAAVVSRLKRNGNCHGRASTTDRAISRRFTHRLLR